MKKFLVLLFLIQLLSGCHSEKPLISNPDRLTDIEKMLKDQKALTHKSLLPIWNILDQAATPAEEQALKFLYAYMPLSDLADYSPEFMRANVKQSLRARNEMAWGNSIPEEEFLHFVLPQRVNNENLDSFRLVYYEEIKSRIKGMPMKEAALEINHWCHEKVNYRGTDSRTSAPMSTIGKTFGRCGEESTFTVSAMRTAGIPSRQVYTPRWAHTDDNHAWVEVWIDGKWHYMGACEPDTDLDRGWFSEPSQRTMLVHCRTYGKYFGSEEVLDAEDRFSELNLTSNYADTKKVTVIVTNPNGKPEDASKVEFKLYNYAEFYPLATLLTDHLGSVRFTTGLGDLLVWASKGGKFVCGQLHVATTDTLRLVLGLPQQAPLTENLDLVPPKVTRPLAAPSEQAKKLNDKRMATEDSIRNHTMASFRDSDWIRSYARNNQLPVDSLMRIFRLSYGNWGEMVKYLQGYSKAERHLLLPLTAGISDKDLSDTKATILKDHLTTALAIGRTAETYDELYNQYVLAPRVDQEQLVAWRSFLLKNLGKEMAEKTQNDIATLADWIRFNIHVDKFANRHSRAPLTPVGVFNLRDADPISRDIFFVAACRTFGIPARLNPQILTPEYYKSGRWHKADFESEAAQPALGRLVLKDQNNSLTPQYTLHFTIARIENGICKTLEFDEGMKASSLPDPLMLETGNYCLVTGKRLPDGTVLSSLTFFKIDKDQTTTVPLTIRKEETITKPLSLLDPKKISLTEIKGNRKSTLSDLMGQHSAVVVLLAPDSEPSKHLLNDLAPYLAQFNSWKGSFIFANTQEKGAANAVFQNYKLPVNSFFTMDATNELDKVITSINRKEAKNDLPVVMFLRKTGEVMMMGTGYKIGMGDALLQLIKNLENDASDKLKSSCTTP